jgi:hypothetical protein
LQQLETLELAEAEYKKQYETIVEKLCLCEGLCSSAYIKYDMLKPRENKAVAICPGPNLAYFSGIYSLEQMVNHIYGATDLLGKIKRPHMFIKELNLYIDYLQTDLRAQINELNDKKKKQLSKFKLQLQEGIAYYKGLFAESTSQTSQLLQEWLHDLTTSEEQLSGIQV